MNNRKLTASSLASDSADQPAQVEAALGDPLMIQIFNNSGEVEATGAFSDWCKDNEIAPLEAEVMRRDLEHGEVLSGGRVRPGYTVRRYPGDWSIVAFDDVGGVIRELVDPNLAVLLDVVLRDGWGFDAGSHYARLELRRGALLISHYQVPAPELGQAQAVGKLR